MGNKKLYLIDATAFCYRAFYALKGLSTSFGQPTNAIYGFVTMLNKILKQKKPDYLAVCFDVSRNTFRQKKFSEYKIQRPPMPDGLTSQIPLIKEIISAYGIAIFEQEGFEADDIIAVLTKKAKDKGLSVTIVSSDKDILQLVDENTEVFSPYKDEGTLYDEEKVFQRYGVKPGGIADIISLMGDDADNIPGIPGIGEKTASELIRDFGSIDNLLNNIDNIKQEKIRKAIKDNLEQVKLNRELISLDRDLKLDLEIDNVKMGQADNEKLFKLFKHLEFKALLKDLSVAEEANNIEAVKIVDDELKDQAVKLKELTFCAIDSNNIILNINEKLVFMDKIGENLKTIFADPKIKKISHDLKKTKTTLAQQGILLNGLYFDTMIAAYLLDPARVDYNLDDLAWRYLEKSIQDKTLNNARAVSLIMALRPKLEEQLQDKNLIALFRDTEMPLVEVLAEMELSGIKLDLKLLKELGLDIDKRLVKLIEDIYSLSGTQFNINSTKQLREVLFERLRLPIVKKGKTGPSTDEGVLKTLASKHELPKMLLEYRQLTKLKNTYVDTLPELVDSKTGRIHTSFNQTVTETGRLSSSNPNLQNIPVKTDIGRKIRQAIVSYSKDSYLLSCDYSQIELRILAHISKDEALIEAFEQGKDIHRLTAALIYGLEEKDITDSMREMTKRVNFGIIYGLTSYGLSRDLGIPLDEAQGFIDAYFARYPRVKEYIQEQILKAQDDGFVTTILGRRRYIPEINNKNQLLRQFAQRQAVNAPIQGSASDLIKLAMIDIHKEIKQKDLKATMIMQIHDELVFDVSSSELNNFAGLVKDKMENILKLTVPVRVDIKKGKNWLEMEDIK